MIEDDAILLQHYAATRSESDFATFVARHINFVYAAALRRCNGDPHRAQEVTQSVFIAVARRATALSRHPLLAAWLHTATRHAAANLFRAERRRKDREVAAACLHALSSAEATPSNWCEARPELDRALDSLSDREREAVLLRFFSARSFAEIGAALHVSEDAARMRVDRALEKLRRLLVRHGVTSTSVALATLLAEQAAIAAPASLAASVTTVATAAMPVGAASALGAYFLMNKTLAAAVAVALVASGTALFESRQASLAHVTAVDHARAEAHLQNELEQAQRHLGELDQRNQALKKDFDRPFNKIPARTPSSGTSVVSPDGEPRLSFIPTPSDPELIRPQIRALNRPTIVQNYAALYRQLRLTPIQAERFTDLRLDATERGSALFKKAVAQAGTKDREVLQTTAQVVNENSTENWIESVRSEFGDTAAETLRQYQTSIGIQTEATRLATALFYSDDPLSLQQADRLVETLAKAARTPDGKADLNALEPERVMALAQTVLSPDQIAAFQVLEDERLARLGGQKTGTTKSFDASNRSFVPAPH